MKTKNFFIVTLFLFVCVQVWATAMSSDIVYIDGEEWELMAKPLTLNDQIRERLYDFLPENHCSTTANPMGYTAFWEIRDSYLYLLRMEVCVYDQNTKQNSTLVYNTDDLKQIVGSYYQNGKICARWVSTKKDIAVGQGDMIWCSTNFFYRNMEKERLLRIEQGKVTQSQTYHNYRREGLTLMEVHDELCERFPWQEYPEYKGHELSFLMKDFQVDSIGHVLDVEVCQIYDRTLKQEFEDSVRFRSLAEGYKKVLRTIYPWNIVYANGKYFAVQGWTSPLINHWYMSIREKEER